MEQKIKALLARIVHPESGRNIVESGMVEHIDAGEGRVTVTLRFEKARDPFALKIKRQVEEAIARELSLDREHVAVIVREAAPKAAPAASQHTFTGGIGKVLAVASGKGGVGKSTVSANLAVALSKLGYSVGLVDLDIYGPSMSLMFGTKERPGANENDEFLPVTAHGVKLLSMGLLINESDPVAVRGPLATRYVQQFLRNVAWGDVDFLILDLPPGTGDIQLTIVQTAELDGVVVVTTPQEVALIDARKAIGLFERVETPILGVIENMSYFQCPSDGKIYHIFGEGGGEREAAKLGVPLLGKIPLDISTRSGGDEGRPVALEDPGQNPVSAAFRQVAEQCARVVLDR